MKHQKFQRFSFALVLALSTSLLAAPALAQSATPGPSAQDLAIAENSFNEGVKLTEQGNCKDAIAQFELSMKMDPGSGTALNLAACYEKVGRTASAFGAYSQSAGLARVKVNNAIREKAEAAMNALAPKLSKVDFKLPKEGAPKGFSVAIDGRPISIDALGAAIPVDPGTREIEASAPGKKPWKASLVVKAEPGTVAFEVPALEDAPPPERAPMPMGAKVVTLGFAAVGAVALGFGIGLGVDSMEKNAASKKLCLPADETKCSAAGVELRNQAFSSATRSNVGIALGAGALVAAGGLFLVSRYVLQRPAANKEAGVTAIDVGPGGVLVRGHW